MPAPINQTITNKQNKQTEPQDLLEWCVGDIIAQMQANSPKIKEKNKLEIEEIKQKLTIKLFNHALLLATEDQVQIDPKLSHELTESESFEEVIVKISLYIQTFPEFGYKFTIYLLTSYMAICLKYKMSPNPDLTNIYKLILEN